MFDAVAASHPLDVTDHPLDRPRGIVFEAEGQRHNHPEGLLAFCFREDPSEEELREAFLRSLDAVRQSAAAWNELDCWRDKYFFDRTIFDLRWQDEGVDAVFGADDLRSIFRCLSRVRRRARAVYNAVGPQVLELLDRHGDLAEEEGALVSGPAYAAAVCHANAYVRDRLRDEAPEGLLDSHCHLRLDDDRQAGSGAASGSSRQALATHSARVGPLRPQAEKR